MAEPTLCPHAHAQRALALLETRPSGFVRTHSGSSNETDATDTQQRNPFTTLSDIARQGDQYEDDSDNLALFQVLAAALPFTFVN